MGNEIDHLVLHSNRPNIFSLGGDLDLFRRLIEAQDKNALLDYGLACVDIVYSAASGYGNNIISYALVQGDALGGGMETALTADYVVMEEHARMGLPEVLFNLFPGMGAHALLKLRLLDGYISNVQQVIESGNMFSAQELYEMGLCYTVAPRGEGEKVMMEVIQHTSEQINVQKMMRKARKIVNPLDKKKMVDIVTIWVDTALQLTTRDLRLMDRLVKRQAKK